MPLKNRARRSKPAHLRVGTAATTAAQTLLVPKYPGAIDTPPTIKDDIHDSRGAWETNADGTVLSSLYQNFASLLIQAIQAEIGPIQTNLDPAKRIAGFPDLRGLLDNLTLADAAVDTGKIRGAIRVKAENTGSWFANQENTTVTVPARLQGTVPVFFAMMNQQTPPTSRVNTFHTNTNFVKGPAIVRTDAFWTTSTQILISIKGAGLLSAGAVDVPINSPDGLFTMNGILLFLESGQVGDGSAAGVGRFPRSIAAPLPLIDGFSPIVPLDMTEHEEEIENTQDALGYGASSVYGASAVGPKGQAADVRARLDKFLEPDGGLNDVAFVTGETHSGAFDENQLGLVVPFGKKISGDTVGGDDYTVMFQVYKKADDGTDATSVPGFFWVFAKTPEAVFIKGRDLRKRPLSGTDTVKYACLAWGNQSTKLFTWP